MGIPITARLPVEFTPPSLRRKIDDENATRLKNGEPEREMIRIMVRVPTPYERDSFAAALVRGGVVHYQKEQVRDLMRAGVAFLHPADKFDEIVGDLELLWQAGDAMNECRRARTDRYIELMEQQSKLPEKDRMSEADMNAELEKIQPDAQIDEPLRVRLTAIQQDIAARYEPLQKAFADLAEQETRRAWLCVEIYVANWHGLKYQPDGNGRGGITRVEAEWLRSEIGAQPFDELAEFIFALHSIDGDEEKNLASLIESYSGQTGSQEEPSRIPMADVSGNSMGESSTKIPATGSAKTTAPSSGSTKPAGKKTGRSKSTQTAGH